MIKYNFTKLETHIYFILFSFLLFNIFVLSWNYSYLPLTEGWFLLGGKFIQDGYLPYEDFYAYLTPFYYWYSYFILSIGDNTILISRILGQLNLNILFYLTYKVLNINFPKSQSIISALFGMIFYLSINAILSYDFIHITNIFALLSYYLISTKKEKKYLFLGGFFAAMCFLTKQSNGAVIFFTIFIIFLYKHWESKKLIIFPFMGCILALILNIFPYLSYSGIVAIFDNIIVNAGNAKGGIFHSLTTLIPPRSDFYSYFKFSKFLSQIFIPLIIILKIHILFSKKIRNLILFDKIESVIFNKKYLFIFLLLSGLIIIIYLFNFKEIAFIKKISDLLFLNKVYLWSGYCPLIFILFYKNKKFDKSLGILLLGLTFAAATSAGLTSVSIFLHAAFLICILLSFKTLYNVGCILALLVIFSYSTISILDKRDKIYHWWGINSFRGDYVSQDIPFISKISNDGISNHLENINKKLIKCKKKPSNLLAFPHGAIINLTTNIPPPTRNVSYWFDFLSNSDAQKEFIKLQSINLDVIVMIDIDEFAWKTHEELFRPEDKFLAQRNINSLLVEKVESKDYEKIYSFLQDKTLIEVYAKKRLLCR